MTVIESSCLIADLNLENMTKVRNILTENEDSKILINLIEKQENA
jgi:hypothetical protein